MGQSKSVIAKQKSELGKNPFPPPLINMDHNYVPKSLTQPLAQAKMVTNSFGNRNFMQPMGRLSMHS